MIDQFVRHRLGELPGTGGFEEGRVPDAEVPLFARIVRAAVRQQDTIDRMIAEALPADWPLARIDPVLRALLRAGAAELAMAGGPPAKVVINEYLDVARGFFTGAGTGPGERGAGPAGASAAAGGVRRVDRTAGEQSDEGPMSFTEMKPMPRRGAAQAWSSSRYQPASNAIALMAARVSVPLRPDNSLAGIHLRRGHGAECADLAPPSGGAHLLRPNTATRSRSPVPRATLRPPG